jgi:hypothetical protein
VPKQDPDPIGSGNASQQDPVGGALLLEVEQLRGVVASLDAAIARRRGQIEALIDPPRSGPAEAGLPAAGDLPGDLVSIADRWARVGAGAVTDPGMGTGRLPSGGLHEADLPDPSWVEENAARAGLRALAAMDELVREDLGDPVDEWFSHCYCSSCPVDVGVEITEDEDGNP